MNRENIIGLVLIVALLIGYSIWMAPSQEEMAERRRVQDSIAQAHQRILDSVILAAQMQQAVVEKADETVEEYHIAEKEYQYREKYGAFAAAALGEEKLFYIETDLMRLSISNKGGRIVSAVLKDFQTFDTLPLELFHIDSSAFNLVFFSQNRMIQTGDLYFTPHWFDPENKGLQNMTVTGTNQLQFAMRLHPLSNGGNIDADRYLEILYTITGDEYMTGIEFRFNGMTELIDANLNHLTLEWRNQLLTQEKNYENERNTTTVYFQYLDDEVDRLSETKDASSSLRTRVRWIGFKQQFFTTTLIANNYFLSGEVATAVNTASEDPRYLEDLSAVLSIPYDATDGYSFAMRLYTGPTKYNILRKYDLGLERQIPLGWGFFLMHWINRFAVIPVFNYLEKFNINYGIIILILTILLKIVLFPLTYKTYTSSARMRVLKPEIEEINKKHPKSEDAMKKQQAIMALYKKAGVNPMAGCIPILIQFPFLIAMFRFFPSSIELRQQPFLWAHDLSTYDSILDLPFTIPFYGDHVSLFTLLMTISTVAYTHINSKMMDTGANQMPGMKLMMYLMPVMFLGFFNNFSAGLSYYYLLANLLTFLQMFIIRRTINEDKIRQQIAENKKKPVKVSGFQKRLAEMARRRGVNTKRK